MIFLDALSESVDMKSLKHTRYLYIKRQLQWPHQELPSVLFSKKQKWGAHGLVSVKLCFRRSRPGSLWCL